MKEGSSLKIKLTLVSGDVWFYNLNQVGWEISAFNETDSTQTYKLLEKETANLTFSLPWGSGVILFEYFENGEAITRSKIVIWG